MHDLKKVKERVEKSLVDSDAESKLFMFYNFHIVLAAIMKKRTNAQKKIKNKAAKRLDDGKMELYKLQMLVKEQQRLVDQQQEEFNEEEAATKRLEAARLKSVRHVNEEILPLRNRVAGVKSQNRIIAKLRDYVETDTLPPASLIQSVLDFNLPFDPQFESKLRGILTVCQADGQSIRTGTSQTTTHSIRELLNLFNVSDAMTGDVSMPVPTHLEVFDEVMEDMSVLALTVATNELIPEHEPQAVDNYNASTTGTEPSTDMSMGFSAAAAASDDVHKPSTGSDSMSVASDAMTLKTIESINGESSVKASGAFGEVKAPSLPEVEDGKLLDWISLLPGTLCRLSRFFFSVSVDGSESSKLGLKHTNLQPNKAAGDSWMTPLKERDGCD